MHIMTKDGWRPFHIKADPPSDHPDYRGPYGPARNIQDRWADEQNRKAHLDKD